MVHQRQSEKQSKMEVKDLEVNDDRRGLRQIAGFRQVDQVQLASKEGLIKPEIN
ncbi:MAG: hypothetical protein M0T74_05655 [Desulfitobacterium hafniense]|nr:hypothetical protein [Desulfitobacterium hafniense]